MWLQRVSLQGAGIALLVSAAIVGWQSTASGQVDLYDWSLRVQDSIVASLPEFLVGPKGGLDTPIPLLVRSVVPDILEETELMARRRRASAAATGAPSRAAVDAGYDWLVATETSLRLTRRLLEREEPAVHAEPAPRRWWWPKAPATQPESALARELKRHPGAQIPGLNGTELLPVHLSQLNATLAALEELPGISELLRVLLKLAAVTPHLNAATARLRAYLHHTTFEAMKLQWSQTEDRFDTLVRLADELVTLCRVRCGELSGFSAQFKQFLIQCTFHGFAVPPNVLVALMEAAAFQSVTRVRFLTARDLVRAQRVEAVRRAPNPWISAAGCAVAIPLVLFACSVVTQLAWLIQVGILGTLVNLVAIAYETSARGRAAAAGLNKLHDVQTRNGRRRITDGARVCETDGSARDAGASSDCST